MGKINIFVDVTGRNFVLNKEGRTIDCDIDELAQLTILLNGLLEQFISSSEKKLDENKESIETSDEVIEELKEESAKQQEEVPQETKVVIKESPKPIESPAKKLINRLERISQRVV